MTSDASTRSIAGGAFDGFEDDDAAAGSILGLPGDESGGQAGKAVADGAEDMELAGRSFVQGLLIRDLGDQFSVAGDHVVKSTGRAGMIDSFPDRFDRSDVRSVQDVGDLPGIAHPPLATRINWAASHAP